MVPLPWIPFDPLPLTPSATQAALEKNTLARMVVHPGLLQGVGLEKLLGRELFDRVVEDGLVEPIP